MDEPTDTHPPAIEPLGDEIELTLQHPLEALSQRLADSGRAVASGLSGGYAAATLTQLVNRWYRRGRLVIVTPTYAQGRQLALDMVAFGAGRLGREVLVVPPPDVSPFGDISPDRERVMDRLNSQFRLVMGEGGRVLVLPVESLMRRGVPWWAIEQASTALGVGETGVDLDQLRNVLVRGGYSAVRLVEDPGTFAIRGGLVDIFSPYEDDPVRIDLFGDEIESIRLFDAQSQRTFEDREEIYIFPVREEILTEKSLANARRRLRAVADTLMLPSARVNDILRDLESGYSFFGIEGLLPAFYELQSPLHLLAEDAVGKTALWVVLERADVLSEAEQIYRRRRTEYEAFVGEGELAFPPEAFYDPPDRVLSALAERRPLLDVGVLAPTHPGGGAPPPTGADDGDPADGGRATDGGLDRAFTFRSQSNAAVTRLRKAHDASEGTVRALVGLIRRWRASYGRIAFACRTPGSAERLSRLLGSNGETTEAVDGPILVDDVQPPPAGALQIYPVELGTGFRSAALGLCVVADAEVFGRRRRRPATRVVEEAMAISHFRELTPNDYIVHLDFGIARYHGMEKLVLDGVTGDYLKLEFAANDKLYLPVHRLGRIQRYLAGDQGTPPLDRLGGTRWEKSKAKVKAHLHELADELLRLYAERASRKSLPFPSPDDYFAEFEAAFPFEETPHQAAAIEDVVADMTARQPMDRLLCGDVGFGKTEVAIRGAFLAVLGGRQVGVLVPTTILAEQHRRTFRDRFRNYPVRIEALSRFRSSREQRQILEDLAAGKIDILIGTHRILSKDVLFRDLGLLVVDEEQRFGVRHKERLKQLKTTVDVLTMTATPIPRTLEMSLLGIRDLSVMLTPPNARLAVRTYVAHFKDSVIREAIEHELRRGGQVFFVHNRVRGIQEIAEKVREVVPRARVAVGHAQMGDSELERVMLDFVSRKVDVLVCTTIIESGLDIVSANTIIINRADAFGLAQLYQLRGRVGRGKLRGYCYLLIPSRRKLPRDAARRLEVIRAHQELGSGITIAQHDLDIRGAGNLLGEDQSGHIRTVGYDLFVELLEEAIRERKGEAVEGAFEPEVKIPVEAYLPTPYIPDEGLRLLFYKRLSLARSQEDLDAVMVELVDRFGRYPPEVARLREVIAIKIDLADLGIERVEAGERAVVLQLSERCRLAPAKVVELVARTQGRYVLKEDMRLVRHLGRRESDDLLAATRSVLGDVWRCV